MKSILLVLVMITFCGFAHAEENGEHQDGPCKKVMDACKAEPKLKIYKECFQPLMNDQNVPGVSIDKADVSACKAKRAAHQQKKGK